MAPPRGNCNCTPQLAAIRIRPDSIGHRGAHCGKSASTQLTEAVEPPGPDSAVPVNGKAVVAAGSNTSDPGGPAGALRVLAWDKPIEQVNILFQNNLVVDSVVSGISIQGDKKNNGVAHPQNGTLFRNNRIQGGAVGIDIRPQAVGSATFESNSITGAAQPYRYAPTLPKQFNTILGAGNQGL